LVSLDPRIVAVKHPFVIASFFLIQLIIIGCGIGAIVIGIKQLQHGRGQTAQQTRLAFWLYVSIGAFTVTAAVIFLYLR
jgi:uncharacterized membrane protein YidH (DUF202 family)